MFLFSYIGLRRAFSVFLVMIFSQMALAQVAIPGTVKIIDLDEEAAKKFSVIRLDGNIVPPIANEFEEAVAKIPTGTRLIIDFNSPGGMNTEGFKIIDIINEAKKSLTIDTFVDNGATCASMCIPLYIQGGVRIAGARSVFMFHGATPWYTNVPDLPATKEYSDALVAGGASAEWIQKIWDQGVFSEPAEYWLSGEDLFNENSNIVTKLKDQLIKHKPWSAPVSPWIKPR